jgi:acyl-coenzyme A thioesterase PaaI-like protein
MKVDITEIAFCKLLGLQKASDPAQSLRLPAGSQYLNHLGTVHAGAQLALAEASSGEFLLRHFGSADNVVGVVRHFAGKFRKPARGALVSAASAAPGALDQATADLTRKGRAFISINVELHDENGAHTLSAVIDWFLQPAENGN